MDKFNRTKILTTELRPMLGRLFLYTTLTAIMPNKFLITYKDNKRYQIGYSIR